METCVEVGSWRLSASFIDCQNPDKREYAIVNSDRISYIFNIARFVNLVFNSCVMCLLVFIAA